MVADETAMRYLGGVQARPVAWRGFLTVAGGWAIQGFGMFSLIEKASGRWIGRLGPFQPEGWPGTEVGWSLTRDAWGKGYATEGAAASIDWAIDHLAWDEVVHCIDAANTPSQAVAKRLGSSILRKTHLPAPFEDFEVDVWGQSASAWCGRRDAL